MNSQLQSQGAMAGLGTLYSEGKGVPQSIKRAVELWKQSAAQGDAVRQRDQAQVHMQTFHKKIFVQTLTYKRKNAS